MAAHRRHVFVEKVLQRLFPNVPSGQEKKEPRTLAIQTPPKKVTSEKATQKPVQPLTADAGSETPTTRRLYTAPGPPEGYVSSWPEPSSCRSPEKVSSGDDTEDQDPHDQPKRRRIRKHKSRKNFKNPNNVLVKQAELEKQQHLLQEKSQRQYTDGPTISKNKKRKLKKKQQIKRKKAAGLVTKAAGINFMYQPEENSSEGADVGEASEEGGADASEEDLMLAKEEDIKDTREEVGADTGEEEDGAEDSEEAPTPAGVEDVQDTEEDGVDAIEEDDEITNEKADSILNFLKSTQKMYFYDGVSRDAASAVLAGAAEELLGCLASHTMPPSDVSVLHHMKTLLLLQDTESLKRALAAFPEHCLMPPDHARVISAFFSYWITHILPEKSSE
ncbi:glutamate-rich protein 1 isoform X3 [Cebus imitator]|uniref:glutamate-rich protein 1 isoform X3 n=1 Tax=Cebus imitator TaxID=2715852 RepID=UPI00080A4216|nr:glutamate-rich protein 1 isoform X3 [Cebus imitator]